jgi:hypothetical protein
VSTQQALQTKRLQASTNFPVLPGQNPILQKTLDRAVEKGYIPAEEKQQVYQKILGMARNYQFAPDDFARLTLMESDGMNPKASNNRCHGIIQFCDGPGSWRRQPRVLPATPRPFWDIACWSSWTWSTNILTTTA